MKAYTREAKFWRALALGQVDDLPESAFTMVGDIDEAIEKAKEMASHG